MRIDYQKPVIKIIKLSDDEQYCLQLEDGFGNDVDTSSMDANFDEWND